MVQICINQFQKTRKRKVEIQNDDQLSPSDAKGLENKFARSSKKIKLEIDNQLTSLTNGLVKECKSVMNHSQKKQCVTKNRKVKIESNDLMMSSECKWNGE